MPPGSPSAAFDLSGLDRGGPAGRRRDRSVEAGKRSFLRMVGHELRTPLNSIIGFSEIIGRELYGPLSEPRYREHADIIRDSGLKLLKMVNQIMEIVRLESGAAEFDRQPLSAVHAIDAAVLALAPEAKSKRVRFRTDVRAPIAQLFADERALSVILANLYQNAVTASPEGGEIVTTVRMAGPRAVLLEICDQGPGVPNDQLARLLRPFEQAEDALTRHGEGAGLGLAIVRLLCEAMAGKLRLHCVPGRGLTATVKLPAA